MRKLLRRLDGPGVLPTPMPAAILEPRTGGMLQVFPHDHRVPQIAAFLAAPADHAAVLLGGTPAGPPRLVRYRPGIGASFRWDDRQSAGVFLKVAAPAAGVAATAERHAALRSAAIERGIEIPRLIGRSDQIAAFSVEALATPDFGQALAQWRMPEIEAMAERVARGLAALHGSVTVPTVTRSHRSFTERDFANRARADAALVERACARSGQAASRLAAWLDESAAPLGQDLAHMDMKLEHALVGRRGIAFIDLDQAALADGLYDLAMTELRIRSAAASGACAQDQAAAAIRGLLRGFPRPRAGGMQLRYRWLRAAAALTVAKHHAQNPVEGWIGRVGAMIDAGNPDPGALPDRLACELVP